MKTTMVFRRTANPKRTTLANLSDAGELVRAERPEYPLAPPTPAANPRRTRLMQLPVPHQAEPTE
jgi:hypothetical protein